MPPDFRVTPFNAQGEGEVPLESKVPMMSKEALDPPEPPANPRVVNYDKTYVELQWWAPDKSDIKHYIIEMQETFLVPKDAAMPEEAEGKGDSDHGPLLLDRTVCLPLFAMWPSFGYPY